MAAPHNEQHTEETSFIQTPKQLITVVVLAFVVPIAIIVLLATLVMSKSRFDSDHPAMTDEAVAQRIKPVGDVILASAAGAAAAGTKSGEAVYKTVCAACHDSGALNAPKTGDKAAWAKLIAEGLDVITRDAIKGIRQMPARGGNPDLSDIEVERAIVFMANKSGASWKDPAVPAAEEKAPAGAPAQTQATAVDGKAVYDKVCMACHMTGVAGAPKTGDKAGWAPRIKQGMDALYSASIKGKGAMPPKGGGADLSDAQIKAAVDYLVGQSK